MVIELHSETLQGNRERQEDYCASRQTSERTVAVVCDGMGGMNGGDIASRTAAELLIADLEKLVLPQDMNTFFRRELEKLDDAVYGLKAADGSRFKAGTTLVSVLLHGRELYWFSVGDSRLLCVRKGEIHCVTRAHNYAMLCEMQSERRGEQLVSYLGMGIAEIYDSNANPFLMQPGDKLLLCTDGLYRTVEQKEIGRILSSSKNVKEASTELKYAVVRKNKANQDNATWVVIGIKGEE